MMKSATIDQGEVAFYSQLADQWWDEQGKFWPLHRLNRLRSEYLRTAICDHFGRTAGVTRPLEGLSILDIGCGGGILAESMAALGARVHGTDIVERNIRIARQHALQSELEIQYEYVDVEEVIERPHRYDVVLNMEVVEHVADLPLFVSLCTQLVARDGILFVATINRNLLSWLFAIVGAEYVLRWLPMGTHSWPRFVKPRELEALLAGNDMTVNALTGVRVNPFNRQFSLSSRHSVNYMLSAIHRHT
jgi:2-polyprenyl-6-hydroxyphenyl methylase / 3-demethylubiquinone-9 3-methyltransferase